MTAEPAAQDLGPGATATSLRRATEILIALGSDEALRRDGLGVVRLAELVGAEKSQASRTLSALAAAGLVDRDPETRAYRLGWRLFALAARSGRPRMISHGPSVLRGLVAATGEAAHLSVLQGGQVLTVLSEAPNAVISAQGWSGRVVPVVCTSSGRALLFDHDLASLEAMLGGAPFGIYGTKAPRDLRELHRRIRAAQERGYATVEEEFEPGLIGVAAPVRDSSGRIIAAINVSGPKFRLRSQLAETGAAVRGAATALSQAMFGALGTGSGPAAGDATAARRADSRRRTVRPPRG